MPLIDAFGVPRSFNHSNLGFLKYSYPFRDDLVYSQVALGLCRKIHPIIVKHDPPMGLRPVLVIELV